MNILFAALLGAIQGITEFLPISSSAHLVIAHNLIPGFAQPGILFDVILHAGTLLAVMIYFRNRIKRLSKNEIILLAIGTVPAVLAGIFFGSVLEESFNNVKMVGIELMISGLFCFAIDRARERINSINKKQSLIIGIAQAFAITPGISRSGATIFAGTAIGIQKAKVAEFSFLLSIPAIGGAIVYEVIKYPSLASLDPVYYTVGFVSSLMFGLISIKFLLKILAQKKFFYFGIYCLIVGGLVFLKF